MNINLYRKGIKTFITDNPKVVLWSGIACFVLTTISVCGSVYLYKRKKKCDTESEMANTINKGAVAIKKMQVETDSDLVKAIQEGEIAIRKKRNDTECDILSEAAHTAFKMMEQATSLTPELKELKSEVLLTKEELMTMKEELAKIQITTTGLGCATTSATASQGHSAEELFTEAPIDNSVWIVYGYMKVGLVNLLVGGGGVGKSIVMMQIALAIAKGACPEFLPAESCNSVKLLVVFYRLEDFSDELHGKYGQGQVLKESGMKFYLSTDLPENTLNGFIEHLKDLAGRIQGDTAVCADPATKLEGYRHAEFIRGVEEAQSIAKERGKTLTVVASAHNDEIKDWNVLTNRDIKGGDKGLQQAGSVTAIRNERTGKDYSFLQSMKEPKGSPKPFNGNVLVMKIENDRIDSNNWYLHYKQI